MRRIVATLVSLPLLLLASGAHAAGPPSLHGGVPVSHPKSPVQGYTCTTYAKVDVHHRRFVWVAEVCVWDNSLEPAGGA